jgi:hypothetical protein
MKTKLFYLFIAVFLFSFSGKSQTYPVITLIGSGNGGWTDTAETPLLTADGITYTLVDKVLTDGELKFREGKCWTGGCPSTVTNVYGWGPTDAQFAIDGGWPSGTNAAPVDGGKNILSKAGVWTITFNRIQGTWSFVPGTPLPVIKLVGSAVSTPGGAVLTSDITGTQFSAKKVTLVPGTCQFSVDGVLAGGLTFPTGDALSPTDAMTITTTGIDYDVTFDYTLYKYVFTVATFPEIGLIGSATTGTQEGWNADIAKMTTTDGITYTLKNQRLYSVNSNTPDAGGPGVPGPGPAKLKFRTYGTWTQDWGGTSFPTGPVAGNNGDIVVTASGVYDITFNKTTGAYAFSFPEIGLIGSGTTGTQEGWNADIAKMATIDGVNYTLTQQLYSVNSNTPDAGGPGVPGPGPAKVKFRTFGAWSQDWGGTSFPTGPIAGNNGDIVVTAPGTYAINFNRLTGVYNFGTPLAVKNFNAGSFKAYPNPTKNSWNITSNDDITSVQVYDMLGKSVYAKAASSKEVSVNASNLSQGVYFAKVSTANGTSTVKLVKE